MGEFKVGEIVQHKLTKEEWIVVKMEKKGRYLCRNSKYGTKNFVLEELEPGGKRSSKRLNDFRKD